MRFCQRFLLAVGLAAGIPTPALAQDQRIPADPPRRRPAERAPIRTPAPEAKQQNRPMRAAALPAGATAHRPETKTVPPVPPPCERELWRVARSPGHLGIMARPDGDHAWRVLAVLPGSLGAREGLRPGDRLWGLRSDASGRHLPLHLTRLESRRIALRIERDGQHLVLPLRWRAAASPKRVQRHRRCLTGRLLAPTGNGRIRLQTEHGVVNPPPGAMARLWWVLKKKHGGLGPGVRIGLGTVRVHDAAASVLRLEQLTETHVTYNGERISVPAKGKPVYLVFEQGRLL